MKIKLKTETSEPLILNDSNDSNIVNVTSTADIFVKKVGGFMGNNTEDSNSLSVHVDTTKITDSEWDYIFTITPPSNKFISYLAVDDFPDDILSDILNESGFDTLQEYIDYLCTHEMDELPDPMLSSDFFMQTGASLEYEGETYSIYRAYCCATGNVAASGLYALLSPDATEDELKPTSMEADVDNRNCPFPIVAKSIELSENPYDDPTENQNHFPLIQVKSIEHITHPLDPAHSADTPTKIIMDDFSEYSIYATMLENGWCKDFDSFISYIKQHGYSAYCTYYNTNETIEYEGATYNLWVNNADDRWGGLIPQDMTLGEIYSHSIECDSKNYYTKWCPFVVRYDWDNNEFYTNEDSPADRISNVICVW